MAILDAFARGIAVIATPVGAVPEVVDHGRNRLIVKVGNVGDLAGALGLLISDGKLRGRLGANARQDHSRCYEIDGYLSEIAKISRRSAA